MSRAAPVNVLQSLKRHRNVVYQMARRDMVERYRGSVLGFLWSLFNPLLMLAVYSFVFSVVFKSTWPGAGNTHADYAINAFVGMIVFTIFSEAVSRSPMLIVGNANLVKKVVFPLEALPWVGIASSLFHALMNYLVLLAFILVFQGKLHATAILFPIVALPVVLFSVGMSWFLASIGVFFRDASHTVALLVAVMMFASPIFYPLSAVPENLRWILELNPLSHAIGYGRSVAVLGVLPDPLGLAALLAVSLAFAWAGLWWFQRTRHAFADVL